MKHKLKTLLHILLIFIGCISILLVIHYSALAYDEYKSRVIPNEDAINQLADYGIQDATILEEVATVYTRFLKGWGRDSTFYRALHNTYLEYNGDIDLHEIYHTIMSNFEIENHVVNCCTSLYKIDGELIESTATGEDIIVNTEYYIKASQGQSGIYIIDDTDYIFYAPIFEHDTNVVIGIIVFKYYVGNYITAD